MQRIYLKDVNLDENLKIEDKDLVNQISKVLRSRVGDEIIFFDGKTYFDYKYKITQIEKKSILLTLGEKIEKNKEKIELNLFQSLPNKLDKLEDILEKGTQVGYTNFTFFKSNRSQGNKLNLSENKISRFERIITESAELAGRNIIPELKFIDKIDLENITGEKYYFHTDNSKSNYLKNMDYSKEKYNLFVGPEGGFDDLEIDNFDKNNFNKIYLGDNILRTQTAGITVGFYFIQNTL